MKRSKRKIIISVTCLGIAACAVVVTAIIMNGGSQQFKLDNEYYAASESIDIDKEAYEKLVSEKKSFVVLIDKPGCTTTAKMRENMANFPYDTQFKYYRMMWNEVKKSSLHDKVKFTPSVAIVKSGEVYKWLQADKDEDTEYFNSGDALRDWIRKYILFE